MKTTRNNKGKCWRLKLRNQTVQGQFIKEDIKNAVMIKELKAPKREFCRFSIAHL